MYELTPIENLQFDLIVPIPLHWTRYAWRGYNQAEEMAKTLSEKLDKSKLLTNKQISYQISRQNCNYII